MSVAPKPPRGEAKTQLKYRDWRPVLDAEFVDGTQEYQTEQYRSRCGHGCDLRLTTYPVLGILSVDMTLQGGPLALRRARDGKSINTSLS